MELKPYDFGAAATPYARFRLTGDELWREEVSQILDSMGLKPGKDFVHAGESIYFYNAAHRTMFILKYKDE